MHDRQCLALITCAIAVASTYRNDFPVLIGGLEAVSSVHIDNDVNRTSGTDKLSPDVFHEHGCIVIECFRHSRLEDVNKSCDVNGDHVSFPL